MNSQSKFLINLFTIFAVLISLFGSAVSFTPVRADSTIIVNTTTDEETTNPNRSLRKAIVTVNTYTTYGGYTVGFGIDTITLPAGKYT